MLPVFRSGLGGTIGTGKQFWSWVSLDDAVGATHHALMQSEIEGPLNVVVPQPINNLYFTEKLSQAMHRWAPFRLPSSVVKVCSGEMGDALFRSSVRAVPEKLRDTGYAFRHADLDHAFRPMLGLSRAPHK